MLDTLVRTDRALFYAVNHGHNAFLDQVMLLLSNEQDGRLAILVVWLVLLVLGKRPERILALLLVPLLVLSDQTSSHLLKQWFQRLRPCLELPDVRLLVGCSNSFSMPSSHAANASAVAWHFSLAYRRLSPALLFLAFGVGYSRIYCGVHYPADVVVGFLVGLAAAVAVRGLHRASRALWLYGRHRASRARWLRRRRAPVANP